MVKKIRQIAIEMRVMSVSSLTLRQLAEAVSFMGLKLPAHVSEVLNNSLNRPEQDEWVSSILLDDCYRYLLQGTGREDLGFQLACSPAVLRYGILPTLVANSPSLAEALDNILRFAPLIQDGPEISLAMDDGEQVGILIEPLCHSDVGRVCRSEFVVMGLMLMLRFYSQGQVEGIHVEMSYPAPKHVLSYANYLQCEVRFDAPETRLIFPRRLMSMGMVGADPILYNSALTSANIALAETRAKKGLVRQLADVMLKSMGSRRSMAEMAAAMGYSERTLRRHLAEAGVDFNRLRDKLLQEVACNQLAENKRSIQQIAMHLGFAQASTFHRAFLRWTGTTPKAWQDARARDSVVQ